MIVRELIDETVNLLKKGLQRSVISAAEYDSVVTDWNKLKGWAYPSLTTDDMINVTRCKNCEYYKRYRKKDAVRALPFYACSKTRLKRDPEFFCKDGEPKYER